MNPAKADLEMIILSLADAYTEEMKLILTVPPLRNISSAIAAVSMDVFLTAKHRAPG